MGAALRSMDSFAMHADVTREDVLSTGQKIQYSGTLDIQSRSRNAFRIDFLSSRQNRSFYYDGQNLTVVAPRANYYASAPVTGTNGDVVQRAREKFDIDFPLCRPLHLRRRSRSDHADYLRDPDRTGDDQRPAMPATCHAPGGN